MSSKTIFEAAHKGDFEYVRDMLEKDPKWLTATDSNARMLIHWAALSGNLKLVKYLTELDSPLNPLDDIETTPLILASSAGHTEIVKLLLKKIDNVNHKTIHGHSSLQYAASKGWTEICKLLLENNADINIIDTRGSTPLHRAASKGNIEIVALFLKYLDKLRINHKDAYGNAPLHLACEEDRQDVALMLVENGGDVDSKNRDGQTPLDLSTPKLARLIKNKLEVIK